MYNEHFRTNHQLLPPMRPRHNNPGPIVRRPSGKLEVENFPKPSDCHVVT